LAQAVDEFNAGAYFACHETLEDLWLATPDPERHLYQGLLMVAAGLLHLERDNRVGAVSLLRKGSNLLRPFVPTSHGLDIVALLADVGRMLSLMAQEEFPEVFFPDRQSRPQIKFIARTPLLLPLN